MAGWGLMEGFAGFGAVDRAVNRAVDGAGNGVGDGDGDEGWRMDLWSGYPWKKVEG